MNRNEVRDALYPNCPIRNVLSRVGDKWSMLVLFTLENNDCQRFKELQRNIPDISQKMLTATLKMLEGDGLIHREVFPEIPPRVEYSLTEKGKSLLPLIDNLLSWASRFLEVLEVNSSTVSNPFCKYFSSTRFLLRLNCIRINAFLACKRCSLRPLLTPL